MHITCARRSLLFERCFPCGKHVRVIGGREAAGLWFEEGLARLKVNAMKEVRVVDKAGGLDAQTGYTV